MPDAGPATGVEAGTRIGVLASGRGSNMEAIIRGCEAGRIPGRVVLVLSDRGSAGALETARAHGVEARHLDPKPYGSREAYDRALVEALQSRGVELVCLAGYMKLVTRDFLGPYAGRVLNIHPSLLPAFPGLKAQQQALDYGAKVSGCTVHLVELAMDRGPIVMQAAVPVAGDDTEQSLADRILKEEHRIYVEAVRLFCLGKVEVEGRRVRIRA
jgi:phosphoribosylglycinamide formyltransferase-1